MDNSKQGTAHVGLPEYLELLKLKEKIESGKKLVIESVYSDFTMNKTYAYFTESEMHEMLVAENGQSLNEVFRLRQLVSSKDREISRLVRDIINLTGKKPSFDETPKIKEISENQKLHFARGLSFWEFLKIKFNK